MVSWILSNKILPILRAGNWNSNYGHHNTLVEFLNCNPLQILKINLILNLRQHNKILDEN